MHKHNFGQTLKIQSAVVTLNIRSRSLTLFYLQTMFQCKFGEEKIRRQSSEKTDFTVCLRMVTMIMR